jgi:hypothetical protein
VLWVRGLCARVVVCVVCGGGVWGFICVLLSILFFIYYNYPEINDDANDDHRVEFSDDVRWGQRRSLNDITISVVNITIH